MQKTTAGTGLRAGALLTHVPTLRFLRAWFGVTGLVLASMALVCCGIAWAAETEIRRQERYRAADDNARSEHVHQPTDRT